LKKTTNPLIMDLIKDEISKKLDDTKYSQDEVLLQKKYYDALTGLKKQYLF